ncbi:UvrABC system protein A [Streptomyces microflavus]
MEVADLVGVLARIDDPVGGPIAAAARERLERLVGIGLGYLSLDRETTTLSGGEGQRLKMVRHLGSSLTGLTFVFDEPSVGLIRVTSGGSAICWCGCGTRATRCWSSSTTRM